MMKLKIFLVLLVLVVGVWMGVNLAKGKPLFSNPFAEKEFRDQLSDSASKVVEESRDTVNRAFQNK